MNWKKWTGLAVFLAVIAFIGWSIYSSTQDEVLPTVRTAEVEEGGLTEIVSTTGVIEASDTQEVAGQGLVDELHVEVGDEVNEGDTLAVYFDELGEQTTYEAAFDGTVTQVNIIEGEPDGNAQQGQPSLVVSDLNTLQVGVRLSRSDANLIEIDQPATLEYSDTEYDGHVSSTDPVATSEDEGMSIPGLSNGGSGTSLGATIAFDSDVEDLIAGFDIDVDIEIAAVENALILPIEALNYDSDNQAFVYTVEDGIAVETSIETGIQSQADIEVTEGLEAGDTVILSPDDEIEDGTEVEIEAE